MTFIMKICNLVIIIDFYGKIKIKIIFFMTEWDSKWLIMWILIIMSGRSIIKYHIYMEIICNKYWSRSNKIYCHNNWFFWYIWLIWNEYGKTTCIIRNIVITIIFYMNKWLSYKNNINMKSLQDKSKYG